MAATVTSWTATTLSAELRGELAGDENAAGGATPDRVIKRVIQSAKDLWTNWDWIFRRKQGTLALVVDDADKDVPSDFAELDQRWLRDNENTGARLRFTQDIGLWQAASDGFADDATGPPRLITIVRDTAEGTWKQHFIITPTSNDSYSYKFWYLVLDPWSAGVIDNDTTAPLWPASFFEGWRLRALWKVRRSFSTKEFAEDAKKDWEEWLDHQLAENNEGITTANEFIQDGYNDVAQFASQLPHYGSSVRFPT